MDILTTDFYRRDTLTVARDLLGREIVRVLPDGTRLGCRITETEAYIGRLDKAPNPSSPRLGRPTSF